MLAQVLALGPLGEQLPGLFAPVFLLPALGIIPDTHFSSMFILLVRVSSGFLGMIGES